MPMFASLFRRRVPHILGLYLGGCWVVVEFVNFLTERYLLSDALTDLTLVALFAMIPAVAMLAWFHGTPGKDTAPKIEKVFVPLNVLATLALVGTMFYGKDLGATATEVTTIDETGQSVTRMAPKLSFRRKLAVFFFDNADDDANTDWLQYGFPALLQRDLEQDAFVSTWSPLYGYEQSGLLSLQRAGFDDGLGAPLPLMRRIAESRNLPAFLTARYESSDGGLSIEAIVHWTDNSKPSVNIDVQGRDAMEAVDALTIEIKRAIDVPSAAANMVQDLTVGEHFSASPEAVRLYMEALVAASINNDSDAAQDKWRAATAEDPSFAAAHLKSAMFAFEAGQTQSAMPAIRAARQHDYKLLPGEGFILKALEYSLDGKSDLVTSVYQTWSELYPNDFDAYRALAFSHLYNSNDLDGALRAFERMRELAPTEYWPLMQMAGIHSIKGDTETSLNLLRQYSDARPQDYAPWLMGGRLRLADGDLDGAREHLERSVVMASGRVSPSLALADLELREGKYAAAQALIDDARSIASVPRQHSSVLGAQIDYFRQRGMFQKAAETTDELYAVDASFRNPVNLMMGTFIDRIEDYVNAGRDAQILSQLADYATQFQPPIDELVQVGYLRYYLFKGDLESAREPAQRVRGVIENFNREDMEYLNDLAQSRMLELAGDLPAAIAAIETSIEKYSQSVQSVQASSDSNIMQNKLAEFLYRTGNADGARDILEEHLIPRPADPRANLTLAKVLAQQGDTDGAKPFLQIALDAWTEADEGYAPAQEARDLAAQW